jgi:hypothetical protein
VACFSLLACRLTVIITILISPETHWSKWRETFFCVARILDGIIMVHVHSVAVLLALERAETPSDRWIEWVNHFLFYGGHWIGSVVLVLVYQVRFNLGFFLQVLHLGICLSIMKWTVLDPAKHYFSDYLEKGSMWCFGTAGERCLAAYLWLRLLIMGFAVPSYFLFRQELCSRRQFLRDAGRHDSDAVKWQFEELWCLLLVYAVTAGTLVGQGQPFEALVRDLFSLS